MRAAGSVTRAAGSVTRAAPILLMLPILIGCATDRQAQHAGRTVAIGWQVVAEAERIAAEAEPTPEVRGAEQAIAQARERFERAQGVVRIWQDTGTGELGWYTLVPCLGAALERLRDRFVAAALELPPDWDQAREMARVDSDARCAERASP